MSKNDFYMDDLSPMVRQEVLDAMERKKSAGGLMDQEMGYKLLFRIQARQSEQRMQVRAALRAAAKYPDLDSEKGIKIVRKQLKSLLKSKRRTDRECDVIERIFHLHPAPRE